MKEIITQKEKIELKNINLIYVVELKLILI